MIKKVLLGVLILVVVILGYAATRPDSFTVERKIKINAPSDKIYGYIIEFNNWSAWSPWAKLDPAMKLTMSSPSAGKGATYAWVGNSDVGEGKMEITDAVPTNKVVINLDFLKPIESVGNVTTFTLGPVGPSTEVTWTMTGPSPYVSKLMGVFVSMDKMIGKDFETGLTQLKAVSEK